MWGWCVDVCSTDWDCLLAQAAIVKTAQNALNRTHAADAAPGWQRVKITAPKGLPECMVSTLESGKQLAVRVECTMSGTKGQIVDLLRRGQGGPKNTTCRVLQQVSDCTCLMWVEVKVPIVTNRDFVVCQWLDEQQDGVCAVVSASVPPKQATKLSAPDKKHVRGKVTFVTFLVSDAGDGQCTVRWLSCVDPGGEFVRCVE